MSDLTLSVNTSFAKKYEEKKRREELGKLKEKYGNSYEEDSSDESLSSDDSDAELVTAEVDAAILKTLAKIRSQDPEVYDPNYSFEEQEEELRKKLTPSLTKKGEKAKSTKQVLLKDFQRERLMEEAGGAVATREKQAPSHFDEQKDLKAETKRLLFEDDSDGEDFLVKRDKSQDEIEREERDYAAFVAKEVGKDGIEAVFTQEEEFLRDYILNRGWLDTSKDKVPTYEDIVGGDVASDDSEFDEKADEFETNYNFRFEEGEHAKEVVTHSRNVENTARKAGDKSSRAKARESVRERKEREKLEQKEEKKRLKALKRKEIEAKLEQIVESGGSGLNDQLVAKLDLEGDWDPEAHDKHMQELYGADYENVDDDEKPVWSDMDDSLGGDSSDDEPARKEKKPKSKGKTLIEKVKDIAPEKKEEVEQMMDEYYAIDYEDNIGGLKTRFKYQQVEPENFSLTPAEILMASDSELNEIVSLKKLAPYREGKTKVGKKGKASIKELKRRIARRLEGAEEDDYNPSKKRKHHGSSERAKPKKRMGRNERDKRKKAAEEEKLKE